MFLLGLSEHFSGKPEENKKIYTHVQVEYHKLSSLTDEARFWEPENKQTKYMHNLIIFAVVITLEPLLPKLLEKKLFIFFILFSDTVIQSEDYWPGGQQLEMLKA